MTARSIIARETLAGGTTVGIRVPAHDVARALAGEFGFCITATSANRSGANRRGRHRRGRSRRCQQVDAVIDAGGVKGGAPSTLVSAHDGRATLVREGAIAWDARAKIAAVMRERAALVGLITDSQRPFDPEHSLDELAGLAKAAGADVVLRLLQERAKPDPANVPRQRQGAARSRSRATRPTSMSSSSTTS